MWCSALAALLAGCSAGGGSESRLSSPSAEPERAGTLSASGRGYRRLVPVVIPPPRPFRVAMVAGRPARLEQPPAAMPLMGPTEGRGGLQLTASEEPLEEPGSLPVVAERTRPVVAAIGEMLAGYREAFNRHDAAAAAGHWAASGENIDLESGQRTAGREAVRRVFHGLFEIDPRASMDIDIAAVRPLQDDVAVVDGISRVAYEDGSVAGSRFSAVVVREDDRWLLANVRETAIPAESRPAGPLDELAWLAGSWENVGGGVTASSVCGWAPGRRFLVRTHQLLPDAAAAALPAAGEIPGLLPPPAGGPQEITEVIGWDPERQTVRSWIFSSDGRFAEAVWSREARGWLISIDGQGQDTGRTAMLSLEPDGPDGLAIRRHGDGPDDLAGLYPPACGFTRTAR